MQDSFIHKGKRKQLLAKLRQKGISDEQVLEAMDQVPRHLFMDSGFLDHAYSDKAFPIAADQTISQPFTVAKQTELLRCAAGQKILEPEVAIKVRFWWLLGSSSIQLNARMNCLRSPLCS